MNNVILIGRLARDPELSYTPSTQTAVAHFTIAVDRPRRNGEDAGADFIRITVFGRQAETCDRYLAKGRQVAVQGRIQTGSYKNREGVTVYTTDVVADRVEFLGGGQGNNQGGSQGGNYNPQSRGGFGGPQDTGFGAPQDTFGGSQDSVLGDFDDLPDTFQAAEDDIPF
ncbi:MAG: single-stranded DNA-binding protein [Mogibacterium sp.]|nr:single-stranded DNA-binding protein [Mogibacterium sp.]